MRAAATNFAAEIWEGGGAQTCGSFEIHTYVNMYIRGLVFRGKGIPTIQEERLREGNTPIWSATKPLWRCLLWNGEHSAYPQPSRVRFP